MKIYGKILTSLSLFCLTTSVALAVTPKPNVYDNGNRWDITFFDDTSPLHTQWATQVICFLPYGSAGTGIKGAWYSLSFPDWNGKYYQEGDELKMTGDYDRNRGHDHMTLQLTTMSPKQEIAFKDWTEWRENTGYGRIIGWGNAKLVRNGKCPTSEKPRDGLSISKNLPERLTVKGEVGRYPGDVNLEPLDEYFERTGILDKIRD